MQRGHLNEMATELLDTESGKGDSLEEERNRGDETTSSGDVGERTSYLQIPFGFQSRGSYKHASKNCEIAGVTYNSRFRQFVFLDSRGITSWSYESVYSTVTRHLNYPSYQFNVLRLITFSRKFNVYFALSKEYALKVFNLNFHEVFSVSADMHSVLCMVFNHVKNELITGGTGGMKGMLSRYGRKLGEAINVWSRSKNGGKVHTLPVFSEGIYWMNIVSPKLIYCCSNRVIEVFSLNHLCDFWALSRCSVTSLSLVTCKGKSSRCSSNFSKASESLHSSPSSCHLALEYGERRGIQQRVQHDNSVQKSRASSPWPSDGNRSPSPVGGDSRPNSSLNRELSGRDSPLLARREKVEITCLGMLYSPIIMQNVEGKVCPDATQFLMAGTQVLQVYHDQTMGIVVTKCRHPGIVILIWSLPALELLKRIDCEADMTCFNRMASRPEIIKAVLAASILMTNWRYFAVPGDILIGFKQHIFIIPNSKVYAVKDGLRSVFEADDFVDETFETDPTDMENYLVPFPNLQLKTSWFMEGRPPVDLEQQNLREEKESISSMSSSLSLAPTEVYFSPTSTPRRLSMASSVAMSDQRRASTELWELPEFGDSPLSSPPRTPPPEPTPPPTPPPKEECEEEPGEGKKNVPSIPTFRRGRMGDISIDSKSLRSGYDGPAYAAPVPGRAPKPVIKKTKKLKENEKQNAEKGSDIQEGGGDEIDSAEIKADKSTDDFIEERREAHNIVQTTNAHVQNIAEGHEWAVDGPDQFGTRHAKDAGATVQIEGHVQTRNVEVKATDDHLPSTPYKTDDGNAGSVLKIIAKTEDENHIGDQTPELDERDDKSENTPQRKEYENRPERVLSRDAMHVVETNRYPEVEMPDDQGSAEILGRFDGDYGFESFVLPEASPGETVLSPPLPSKGSVRGHKRVSFRSRGGEKGRNSRQMSAGRNSPSSRVHSAGVTLKESVVPVYIGRRQSDMLNEISKDSMNVTPLTIFALARSRRENTETKYGLFVDERLRQKNETTEASRLRSKTKDKDIFEHSYGDYNSRLVGKGDLNGPDKCFENAALSRPSSVKKSESSLMRWCMRALKKAEREVLFPPKPTRPKSSSSCVNSGEAKKERGHTLYLNTNDNPQRPKTADTICSSTSSADEHSVFPYDNSFSTNETLRQKSRDLKSAAPLAQGGKWQQGTIEDDEDFMDAYRDMRASLGLQGLDEASGNNQRNWRESISKSETVIEFITPPPTIPSRATTPLPPRDQLQSRLVKEQECASEQPYRLKLHSQSVDLRLDPVARDLIALKACDHHVADVVNVLPRPPRSASIPSKCSHYVLVAQPDVQQSKMQATAMEETLLMARFPKTRLRKLNHSAT
ncbi:hypothetical protein P5673_028662 [Acropora cervicornis]|uniref:Uncharacterized protein n=1 Tax=Acropora cervicornis TaxID=6130 RepID=A0AAD9PXE4_ACRCE|nr:hypothetical protein P5673_028662 [Acropora cervicornis]